MTCTTKSARLVAVAGVMVASTLLLAQTRIDVPKNKYKVSDDVKLGKEAADEVRKQLPLINDDSVSSYTADLGRKLAAVIPAEYAHAEFQYTFQTVNVRDINAFALPGGPMFVNRGMIEAANAEGEVVGVMAHEMSHVMLRHGTANMTKAQSIWVQLGQLGSLATGAIVGGSLGSIISQTGQLGVGTVLLKNSRDFEKNADLLGAQLMSRAGYDARDMANMFRTIEKEGKSGPQFLSDHPNPGNRVDYITKEATSLHVDNPIHESAAFDKVRAHLKEMPKAPTTEEATKNAKTSAADTSSSSPSSPRAGDAVPTGRVAAPASRYTQYTEGNIFQVAVPSNWDELPSGTSVTFAPKGGYGTSNGQSVFTHGVEIGVSRNDTRDLQTQTDELIDSLHRGNPRMSRPSAYRRATIGGRNGLQTTIDNVSEATGAREVIQIVTTVMRDGNLFYAIFVAPSDEYNGYQPVFQRVASSIRLAN